MIRAMERVPMPNSTAAESTRTLGADLVSLQSTGLSSEYLFDVYGTGEAIVGNSPECRAYLNAADLARSVLSIMGLRSRNGTHFRLAGAVLREIAKAPTCERCSGAGRLQLNVARVELICPGCLGSGLRRESVTWRAGAMDCHYTDFRDRLQSVYQVTLTMLVGLRSRALGSPLHALR